MPFGIFFLSHSTRFIEIRATRPSRRVLRRLASHYHPHKQCPKCVQKKYTCSLFFFAHAEDVQKNIKQNFCIPTKRHIALQFILHETSTQFCAPYPFSSIHHVLYSISLMHNSEVHAAVLFLSESFLSYVHPWFLSYSSSFFEYIAAYRVHFAFYLFILYLNIFFVPCKM